MYPREPKSGSASQRPERWFHFKLEGRGWIGRSHVTFGTITAEMLKTLEGKCIDHTLKWVRAWEDGEDMPSIPEIKLLWLERGRWSCWASCWEIKETDEPESRRALDSVIVPSGDCIMTQHVISNTWVSGLVAAWLETEVLVAFVVGSLVIVCNNVWWGLWHWQQWWDDLQSLAWWSGWRQLMHRPWDFTIDILSSLPSDLKCEQE